MIEKIAANLLTFLILNYILPVNGLVCNAAVTHEDLTPSLLNTITVLNNPTSCNATDGSVQINASTGIAPYTYSLDGINFSANNIFSNLGPGTYIALIVDANGDEVSRKFILTGVGAFSANLIQINGVSCAGDMDGSFRINGLNGSNNYSYSIDDTNFGNSGEFTNLSPQIYNVKIRDNNNGCIVNYAVRVEEPDPVTGEISSLNPVDCQGQNTGSVNITGQGGTAPYTYSLDGVQFYNNGNFNGLTQGTYTVEIRDNNACSGSVTFTITEPSALMLTLVDKMDVLCQGESSGEIDVMASGGSVPYQFSIDGINFGNNNVFQNLPIGSYQVFVRDNSGCTAFVDVQLDEPNKLLANMVSKKDISCSGLTDGEVEVEGIAGVPPYQYSIDGIAFQNSPLFTGLDAQAHTVYVRDANNCLASVQVNIIQPPTMNVGISNIKHVDCYGTNTGEVTAFSSGGLSPYSFSINNVNFVSNANIGGLMAGDYKIYVKDASGCVASEDFTITQPDQLILQVEEKVDVSCHGTATGSLKLQTTGGVGSIHRFSTDGINFNLDSIFTSLSAGTYSYSVLDENGCLATLDVEITEPPLLETEVLDQTPVSCTGLSDGLVAVGAAGGTPPYEFAIEGQGFQPSPNIVGLEAGSYELVTQDENQCKDTVDFTITEPQPLKLTANDVKGVSCTGADDGSISLSATGGTPAYRISFNNGPFGNQSTFTNLGTGTYIIVLEDQSGCTDQISVTIENPSPLEIVTDELKDASCAGQNDGLISVSANGGVAPYAYQISGSIYTGISSFSQLIPGDYTINVRDDNGCVATENFTINEPPAINIEIAEKIDPNCFDSPTGRLVVRANGGNAPYQFSLGNGITSTNGTFENLTAGTYTLQVSDVGSCVVEQEISLINPSQLSATTEILNEISCSGMADGRARAIASGGQAPYTFTWMPGNINGPTANNLASGEYTVTISDQTGCSITETVSISEPNPLIINPLQINSVSCNGAQDGSISLAPQGGIAPYSFAWSNGETTGEIDQLVAGQYSVSISDQRGCSQDTSIIIAQPSELAVALQLTNPSCADINDGQALAVASGGTPPYTYIWDHDPNFSQAGAGNLAPGSYGVTVIDRNNCSVSSTAIISPPSAIVLTFVTVDDKCSDGVGQATVNAIGGTGPYQYFWSTDTLQTLATASNLAEGTYEVVVTDSRGCDVSGSVSISNVAPPVVETVLVQDVSCAGESNGVAEVLASGGTGTYTYSWDDPESQLGPRAINLSAGIQIVQVDDGRCIIDYPVEIQEPMPLLARVDDSSGPSCAGFSDGYALAEISGGSGPYNYLWSTNPIQNTARAENLSEGRYLLQVTDGNGCTTQTDIEILEPAPLDLLMTHEDVKCFGGQDGFIQADVSGGTLPYQYNWSNGSGLNYNNGLSVGNYELEVIDQNGCTISDQVEINQPEALEVISSHNDLLCFGASDAVASVNVSGGTQPYTYLWSTGEQSNNISNLAAGEYTVLIQDSVGCTEEEIIAISSPPQLEVRIERLDEPYCNEANGSITIQAEGGNPGYQYQWQDGTNSPTLNGVLGEPLEGPYTVNITDGNGCSQSFDIPIKNLGPPTAGFTTNIDISKPILLSDAQIEFNNTSQGAVAFQWDFGYGNQISDLENPIYEYQEPGIYTITLTAFDPNFSCPTETQITLEIIPDGAVYIPSAFSPNGDGRNDLFKVVGEGIVNMELIINDRWGREVLRTRDLNSGWNGYSFDGRIAQEGVYTYFLKASLNSGAVVERSGTITLLR